MSVDGLYKSSDAENSGTDYDGPFATQFVGNGPYCEASDKGTQLLERVCKGGVASSFLLRVTEVAFKGG